MKKVFVISILLFSVVLYVWGIPFFGAPKEYMVISSGPSISADASGTYTYYIRENGTSVPTHPDPVSMTISGTAMGLGWIDFKITSIKINGSEHLTEPQVGEAPTDTIGYMASLGWVHFSDRAKNDDFSHSVKAATWIDDPGTYDWSASGQALRKIARWDGGQWVVHNKTSDPTFTHAARGSGSWTVKENNVCSVCKQTGLTSTTAHYVNPCPNAGCQEGGSYWNCYGVPSSHALLATCSSCNASSVYACSGHPGSCGSGSGSGFGSGSTPPAPTAPTDNTPNCQDCTSDCSSPCSCSNSGTCGGTVTDNTPDCSYCTDGCSSCQSSSDDDDDDDTTTCSAGHSYNPNSTYAVNLHRDRTCRFSGCGNSWQACSISGWSPLCNNAYRKSKGWKCGAQ